MAATKDFLSVVSGLPRSGTSMMMQMIDQGGVPVLTDHVRQADEDNPKGYYEFEAVKRTRKDASWLGDAAGKVVKMVHLLLMDLPLNREYRVVFMKRNLQEVVVSQDIMLERLGKQKAGLEKERLIGAFRTQLDRVDKWVRDHPKVFKILYVDYNEVMRDPRPAAEAVNEFLGGDLDTEAMVQVVDPSLYRNRQGMDGTGPPTGQ